MLFNSLIFSEIKMLFMCLLAMCIPLLWSVYSLWLLYYEEVIFFSVHLHWFWLLILFFPVACLLPLFIVSFVTQNTFVLMYLLCLSLAFMVYVFTPNWRNISLSQREGQIILCFLLTVSRFIFTHWGLWYLHQELVFLFSVR